MHLNFLTIRPEKRTNNIHAVAILCIRRTKIFIMYQMKLNHGDEIIFCRIPCLTNDKVRIFFCRIGEPGKENKKASGSRPMHDDQSHGLSFKTYTQL